MKNLRQVTLELREPGESCCSFPKSRKTDRDLHRLGLCIIHLGALHGHCPNLVKFNGIKLEGMNKTFTQWNTKVKKLFFEDYIRRGGQLEFKAWAGTRWFKKQPQVPTVSGKNRLPQVI